MTADLNDKNIDFPIFFLTFEIGIFNNQIFLWWKKLVINNFPNMSCHISLKKLTYYFFYSWTRRWSADWTSESWSTRVVTTNWTRILSCWSRRVRWTVAVGVVVVVAAVVARARVAGAVAAGGGGVVAARRAVERVGAARAVVEGDAEEDVADACARTATMTSICSRRSRWSPRGPLPRPELSLSRRRAAAGRARAAAAATLPLTANRHSTATERGPMRLPKRNRLLYNIYIFFMNLHFTFSWIRTTRYSHDFFIWKPFFGYVEYRWFTISIKLIIVLP